MKDGDSDSQADDLYVELNIRAANKVLQEVSKGTDFR